MLRGETRQNDREQHDAAPRWHAGEAALPVTFAGTVGLYTPAAASATPSDIAVLFLSPWGFEEMCTRKLWRLIAERVAVHGVASLRFDYPGTGDALDAPEEQCLETWSQAILEAGRTLRRLSGAARLVLVGHGLGATLAARLGNALDSEAAVLMAPVVSGRFYLRELSAWSKMVDEGLGLRSEQRIAGRVAVAGLVMPEKVAEAVKSLGIDRLEMLPFAKALVVERPGREKDAALAAHLSSLGADLARMDYAGYDDLVSNPTLAHQPQAVIDGVVHWLAGLTKAGGRARAAAEPTGPAPLTGDGFVEEPLRFGENNRLFGTLCGPQGQRHGAAVLLLGTAYDRQAGWARGTTETARYLAQHGIVSLRFDAANVADSPPAPDAPEQVQYSETQLADVRAAMDFLVSRNLAPILLSGRCSGAYLAFRAAVTDERAAGVVSVNPFTFRWDPDMSVDEALRANPRSLDDYRQRAFDPATFRRLLAGEIDLRRAAGNVGVQIARRLAVIAPRTLGRFSRFGRLRGDTQADFRLLAKRGVPVLLVYSEGDVGLERLKLDFGRTGLDSYHNVAVEMIPDADHNLSPPHAQAAYRALLLKAALKFA
ncbi:alpha/beta fold hydrolase [Shinella kummerowiae]|jgi:pimeloyl-ACP methyl ester carboxylesterase|uniref:Alpha/beta fold hydrolase n=1 Tax=Shinella kummerowiae TaxID=417745 RepID=A0A6N8S7P7_9HYPH|nr:alpha/beta hydrolase family protein [Shinella kummerowiae]MXN45074.1 alpha/beta fold hydrolase [Shinella kummerowiae]